LRAAARRQTETGAPPSRAVPAWCAHPAHPPPRCASPRVKGRAVPIRLLASLANMLWEEEQSRGTRRDTQHNKGLPGRHVRESGG